MKSSLFRFADLCFHACKFNLICPIFVNLWILCEFCKGGDGWREEWERAQPPTTYSTHRTLFKQTTISYSKGHTTMRESMGGPRVGAGCTVHTCRAEKGDAQKPN